MNSLVFIDSNFAGYQKFFQVNLDSSRKPVVALVGDHGLRTQLNTWLNSVYSDIRIEEDVQDGAIVCCLDSDPVRLSQRLMALAHLRNVTVVAPVTAHYSQNRSLYTVSVPKGGTHMLFELVEALGFSMNHFSTTRPKAGNAYYLEHSNSHTKATSFFIDTVYRSEFGGRDHPFTYTPCLFMYRHPFDILVSEARYYPKTNNTLFYQYLNNLPFEECITRLIDDPRLLGSLRDRLMDYAAWFEFENVIPLAFESLVGEKGGGCNDLRDRLIWSLQLKLHVSGKPHEIGDKVFNPDSPTFNKGMIGGYQDHLQPEHLKQLGKLNSDYMEFFGYRASEVMSVNMDEHIDRPLIVPDQPDFPPILIEHDYQGFNIVKYRNEYFGLVLGREFDFDKLDSQPKEAHNVIRNADLNAVKSHIMQNGTGIARRIKHTLRDIVKNGS